MPFSISPADLDADIRAFHAARAARISDEKGWLSVIEKVWLSDGVYRIGAAPGSEIALPGDRAPVVLGTLTVRKGVVVLDVADGVDARARGERVSSLELRSDADLHPDDVVSGPFTLQLLRRGDAVALRVRDAASPARLAFTGIPSYRVDPAWRIVADLEPYAVEKEVVYQDGDGRPQPYRSPGVAVFEREGTRFRVEPVWENDRKRLFLLFGDATNRDETYGAGRFLYAPLPELGKVLLDFNKAFNPPCAFTPHATCPLPSPGNRLPLRIEAGEKRPS